MTDSIVMYTDGASRGNPGPASYGVYIQKNEQTYVELKSYLGQQTNNYAEYAGIIAALEWLKDSGHKIATLRSDSELLIKQLKGQYKVKSETLKPLYLKAKALLAENKLQVQFEHIRREYNKQADSLANQALDEL